MCTVVIDIDLGKDFPCLIAANRDERLDRPTRPPGRHWPDQPGVIGGLDLLAGGSWLAMNDSSIAAALLNAQGTLGPQAGKESRGRLPLLALRHSSIADATRAIAALDGTLYRGFHLLLASKEEAFLLTGTGTADIALQTLLPGQHMITAWGLDTPDCPRTARHLPRFRAADRPTGSEWQSWIPLLEDTDPPRDAAMTVTPEHRFATVSTSLLAIGAAETKFFYKDRTRPAQGFAPAE